MIQSDGKRYYKKQFVKQKTNFNNPTVSGARELVWSLQVGLVGAPAPGPGVCDKEGDVENNI